ncbi:MAG: RbsD/FucU domain-containing protein [Gammaproteobacteria bacterium]
MLININPLLSADLLHALRSMGHGDELTLVDANFPAASNARRLIQLDGADLLQAGAAILSVFPLDSFVEYAVLRMEVVDKPKEIPPVQKDFQKILDGAAGRKIKMGSIERHAFYERARASYAIVATGERRPYGCITLVKGVLKPDGGVWW